MSKCYVYWIKRPCHTNPETDGYVGISKDVALRWKHHLYRAKTSAKNHKLYNALSKYEDFSITTLFEGSREECLLKEFELRPDKNIGLNHAVGGCIVSTTTTSYDFTTEVKKKISEGLKRAYETNPEYREAVKARNLGKVRTSEQKQLLSDIKKGTGKGWKNSRCTNLDMWKNADEHYLSFLRMVDDCKEKTHKYSVKMFCEYTGISFSSHRAIYKMFREGWIPMNDAEWQQEFNK